MIRRRGMERVEMAPMMISPCHSPSKGEESYSSRRRESKRKSRTTAFFRSFNNGESRQQLRTLLFFIMTTFFTTVGGKFGGRPPSIMEMNELDSSFSSSSSSQSSSAAVLLNYSGPQPSDKFISCHFNPGCFCKYDQKTELHESLKRLWQLSGFNMTSYARAVAVLQREIRNDPTTTYFFPESDFKKIAQSAINSSTSYSSYYSPLQYSYSAYSSSSAASSSGSQGGNQRGRRGGEEEQGPIFEFVCLAVPMAAIPTEYNAHGMMSHVSVTGSTLGMLDASAFAGLEIQNIQLSRDHLYSVSEYAFSSMGNVLTVLDLSANSLDEIPFAAFKALKILEWLNLSNNLLNSVIGDWLSISESIRQLSLSSNSIDTLPFELFPNFDRLMWLDLSSNFIRNLSQAELPPNLQTLILMKNRFQTFPSSVFHLESLSWLILGGCSIDRIPTEWPRGVPAPLQLNQMDLTENFIQKWPSRAFGAQLTVLDLDVSKNYIQVLPAGSFHSMNSFRLSLGYNQIRLIDPEAFATLEYSLQYLNLENNRLPGIPWKELQNLTSLMHLYVGSNQLTDEAVGVPEAGIDCKLTYLGLNGNQLSRVPRRILARCPNLHHLNLGYNQIAHLDDLALLTMAATSTSASTTTSTEKSADSFSAGGVGGGSIRRLKNLSTLVLRNNPIYSLAFSGSTGSGSTSTHHFLHHRSRLGHHHHHHNHHSHLHFEAAGLTKAGGKEHHHIHHHHNSQHHHHHHQQHPSNFSSSEGGGITTDTSVESLTTTEAEGAASAAYHSAPLLLPSIPNVFRTEAFPNLYELSLSFCQLSGELEPFPSLPLTNLEISMGLKSATTITPNMFQALKNLEWLALDYNSLQSVSDYSFYSNRNLTYVNLEWNRIELLPRQMFHPDIHQSISQVRLSHNRIQTILSDSFLSFPAINLDLSYNLISALERQAFYVVPYGSSSSGHELTSVPSSNNNKAPASSSSSLPFFSSRTSSLLPGLNLYLNRNKLVIMKPNALAGEKFSLVDLSYNQLVSFNFDTFGRHTLLGGLNLSHNSIDRIVVPKSGGNRRFILDKFLDLSHNRLGYRGGSGALLNVCPSLLLHLGNNRLERTDFKLFPLNCSIREVNLNNNYITSLDPESFVNLRDLTVLHLSNNRISFVPEILFIRNAKLNYLDLSRNKIRSLPRDALVGSSVEILNLGSNQFVNLPVNALSQISRRLRRLDMSGNVLEHLDSTMFEPIAGLVHLNLSQNRLTILPDNAFANLASLRELDVSSNPHLRANFKELFHFLPKLKVLRLANCGIRTLPMLPLPHLISLDLSRNGMEEISVQSLSSLGRLRVLDLKDNELSNTNLPSWAALANLVTLKMSGNPLRSLTKDTFHGLSRLETLEILDMGRIDRFDSDVLANLVNLRSLAVETYPNIEKYRFRIGSVISGIPYLEELFVEIKESLLSDQLLGGILPKLRKLTITGSSLKKIEPNALDGLQNCFHMDLTITHTGIDDIPPRVFELLQHAEWARLDISHNKMSSLDSSALYPNRSVWFSKGTRLLQGGLILDGNDWICDCDLVWIGEWLRRWLRESFESHSTTIPLVHSMYEEIRRPSCVDPKGASGKTIPLIELYSDVMCHASALSRGASSPIPLFQIISNPFKTLFNLLLVRTRAEKKVPIVLQHGAAEEEMEGSGTLFLLKGLFSLENLLTCYWLYLILSRMFPLLLQAITILLTSCLRMGRLIGFSLESRPSSPISPLYNANTTYTETR